MAIRPVTQASFVNGYNNVNFEGKKKKQSAEGSSITNSVSHKLAVPLAATIIAMSPSPARAADYEYFNDVDEIENTEGLLPNTAGKIVEQKKFVYPKPRNNYQTYKAYTVSLISNDGDDNTIEKIRLETQHWEGSAKGHKPGSKRVLDVNAVVCCNDESSYQRILLFGYEKTFYHDKSGEIIPEPYYEGYSSIEPSGGWATSELPGQYILKVLSDPERNNTKIKVLDVDWRTYSTIESNKLDNFSDELKAALGIE